MTNNIYKTKRVQAIVIDILTSSIIASILSSFMYKRGDVIDFQFLSFDLWYLTYNLIILVYFLLFDFFANGLTIGKSISSIKIVSNDNHELTLTKRLIRSIVKWCSILILPISLILYFFFDYYTIQDSYSKTKTVSY